METTEQMSDTTREWMARQVLEEAKRVRVRPAEIFAVKKRREAFVTRLSREITVTDDMLAECEQHVRTICEREGRFFDDTPPKKAEKRRWSDPEVDRMIGTIDRILASR